MGFLSNLFGLKTKYVDEETDQAELAAEQERRKPFFLAPEEAKTLGNREDMRSPSQQQSTTNQQNPQSIQPSPGVEPVVLSKQEQKPTAEPQLTNQGTQNNPEVAESDSNMDMFRKMARDLRKY